MMRLFHFVSLLAIACLIPFSNANGIGQDHANTLMKLAEENYAEGNYTEALAIYDSLNVEYSGTTLLYNIGNCHFKLGDVPRAILFFERALRLAPGDEDVLSNLRLAREQIVDRVNAPEAFSLGSAWSRFRAGGDPDQWARYALWSVLAIFVCLACALYFKQRMLRRLLFALSTVAVITSIIVISFASYRYLEIDDNSQAIILTPKVDVRSEPREGSTVLFVLHKGTKVDILQETNSWFEVSLPNGTVGWMPPATLERI
ncbi:MAG: tetratricopeptide repeat protein [Flavobacteriales bacterium]|nr:tetratricopeptide repeat protein [Flavobacteriales bacterium]MBK6944956.1 tetratricopeptide repeat protein [Flavobacteriales bacterium]MBK7239305.1 tetratricopeptide repeat protein [Flavobacteriales bacterium]MBK9535490.1 tetratricopeptide repeat protein [Flavobacteriales bacterium]MBP9139683.1 tetratricopeptide repeat protein [Flavobacteriales bacterium]